MCENGQKPPSMDIISCVRHNKLSNPSNNGHLDFSRFLAAQCLFDRLKPAGNGLPGRLRA
jgi:hypothetical protein